MNSRFCQLLLGLGHCWIRCSKTTNVLMLFCGFLRIEKVYLRFSARNSRLKEIMLAQATATGHLYGSKPSINHHRSHFRIGDRSSAVMRRPRKMIDQCRQPHLDLPLVRALICPNRFATHAACVVCWVSISKYRLDNLHAQTKKTSWWMRNATGIGEAHWATSKVSAFAQDDISSGFESRIRLCVLNSIPLRPY